MNETGTEAGPASPADEGLRSVLVALGASRARCLGHGGEAWVFALDAHRVVRVLHEGGTTHDVTARGAVVAELRGRHAPFALPEVLETGRHAGRCYAIERRLPGTPVSRLLTTLDGPARDALVEHHLDAAAQLGALPLAPRGWFGELVGDEPVRSSSWRGYLRDRATASLGRGGPELATVEPAALADAFPEVTTGRFVHLDAFAGNMLATGTTVTAVLDVGTTSVAGDARLDSVAAAVYLAAPEITPAATSRDTDVARRWLRDAGLAEWFEPASRWLAAFWSFATDDVALHHWCRRILVPS